MGSSIRKKRDRRVLGHLDLVAGVARRIRMQLPESIELEDLIQAGMLGLLQAAATYNPSQGPFNFWAKLRIRGAIMDALRTDMAALGIRAVRTSGERPAFQFAKRADLTTRHPNLLEFPPEPEEPGEEFQIWCALHRAISALSPRQRRLIDLVYGQSCSLRAIGRSKALGIAYSGVQKEHRQALDILRQTLEANRGRKAA